MTYIKAESLFLSFPVFGVQSRSLKRSLLKMTIGGKLNLHDHSIVIDALSDVSFSISGGDRLALIGHNGSGKSTLLRVLAKVYKPTKGELISEGSISALLDTALGMDHEATGYENIKIRALLLGLSKSQRPALIADVEEFSELGEFLNMPVRTYSTGMMVRLSFALSTLVAPNILLIDEAIGAGDSHFIHKARARMERLIQKSEILILASHNISTVKDFCNKVLWLEHGRIRAFGDVETVTDEYNRTSSA
ncbi:MAG: hypothetical protein A3G13_01850 [Candidatus Levybacteria bacterium RIFCSPLOWO2_12_FULL_37_7]|nr:MAG: hypothetical protein A3G13_01850 [Candidatus Levybacteria bacterium RIFCSPLOWO2_12_FULL_37_7]OGT22878.1 MAG: hypothetical protein A3C55_05080 [Gammaproteobacteria bacterium RIFCSPHIGHO2_02_FULL_42_13]OGT71017.1 MAG: hypothetical protein A3H43_03195 [Gammaproteobacteria bacterium RIFCSPLOWO2_02_FULL_42_9]